MSIVATSKLNLGFGYLLACGNDWGDCMWVLWIDAGFHIGAAFVHVFYYRDGAMWRMLPADMMDDSR